MQHPKVTKKHLLISLSLLASLLTVSESKAQGIVKINNHSRHNIKVDIVPAPTSHCPSYCWKCLRGSVEANTMTTKQIFLPVDAFKGGEFYSIFGTEGGMIGSGECQGLSILKDYEVSFYETTLGLRCEYKAI